MFKLCLILIISLIVGCTSCKKNKYKDDEFTLSRTNYSGNQLRIDGFYSTQLNSDYQGNLLFGYYFLYRNGALLSGGDIKITPKEFGDYFYNYFSNNHEFYISNKTSWGLFVITDSVIKIESVEPGMIEGDRVYISTGKILNDTSFVLTESKRSKDGTEYTKVNTFFYFNQYSPKPDSTNNFIK